MDIQCLVHSSHNILQQIIDVSQTDFNTHTFIGCHVEYN